jgi:hypothetical protein
MTQTFSAALDPKVAREEGQPAALYLLISSNSASREN